jgi:hypothetical protein
MPKNIEYPIDQDGRNELHWAMQRGNISHKDC